MPVRFCRLILLVLTAVTALGGSAQERHVFSNLSLRHGLSQITVLSIFQDRDGYMWFGTRNGLNMYDGYGFHTYRYDMENPETISDNHILCMTQDSQGALWIGTNNGLNRLDASTETFTRYFYSPGDSATIRHNIINGLCLDGNGNLWVGTRGGMSLYDPASDSFRQVDIGEFSPADAVTTIVRHGDDLYIGTMTRGIIVYNIPDGRYHILTHEHSLSHDNVKTIRIDRYGTLWAGTQNHGVCYRKKDGKRFTLLDASNGLTSDYIRCIEESPDGKIVIGTFNGLSIVDPLTGRIDRYTTYGGVNGNLSQNSVHSLYFDRSGTLWVGTYSGGVNYSNRYGNQFRFYSPEAAAGFHFSLLGTILETEQCVYFATEGTGMLEWDKHTNTFLGYSPFPKEEGDMTPCIIKSLYRQDERTLLCGTNVGTVYAFDLTSKRFSLYRTLPYEDPIYYLGRNHAGELVIGCVTDPAGLVIGSQSRFRLEDGTQRSFSNVRCLLEITPDRYLIGTRNEGLYDYDRSTGKLLQYRKSGHEQDHTMNIPENYVSALHRGNDGRIWVGTFGGGLALFDPASGHFITWSSHKGLPDDNVCSIVEDRAGHLWISTISGISDFTPDEGNFRNYTDSNGIGVTEFTPHSGTMLSGGRIVFSGNNGFVTFDPAAMEFNPYVPEIVLRNLYIHNNPIRPGDGSGVLSRRVNDQQRIVLGYDRSNFSIEYSALNYISPERNQYAYRLEGFDQQWNETGTRRIAYYTNVPSGKYRFVVRGSNNDGIWNEKGASLEIVVLPPFWNTWWAWVLYVLLTAGIVVFVIRYFSERRRLEHSIRLKQAESRAQAEFHETRDRLFTNFSHELRTPLTLIMSPLEEIMGWEDDLTKRVRENLKLMQDNAHRLLRLVNNLMDFQKKQSGKLQLRLSEGDFVLFAREMTDTFSQLALSRDITVDFQPHRPSLVWWFDPGLMEKVFFNLLSNAFKNTPNGGSVSVDVGAVDEQELSERYSAHTTRMNPPGTRYVVFRISDSGQGIPAGEEEKIFTPFYQVAQNEHSVSGTGLGLSLSRSIVEMHRGSVIAGTEGGGAVFTVVMPMLRTSSQQDSAHANPDTVPLPHRHVELSDGNADPAKEVKPHELTPKSHTVLVAEDNSDVRSYITSHLSALYKVLEAFNGEDAFDKAVANLPDLIITDLMMPKMDGMELAAKLHEDMRTSHIPIIMLTAKAMNDDIQKGYEQGADDYIVKPFNSSLLLARVGNLIHSRENLKAIYGKRFDLNTLGVNVTSLDERFMNKVYALLEKNLSNPQFNLDSFSKEVGMSRANLYRKIKQVTDLSPNEFIRNFRLEIAANMLKQARMPVSDVYVAVGFSSHPYFSNCFKALYGITPSEFVARNTDNCARDDR